MAACICIVHKPENDKSDIGEVEGRGESTKDGSDSTRADITRGKRDRKSMKMVRGQKRTCCDEVKVLLSKSTS